MRRTPDVTRSLFGVPQQTQSAKAEVYYLRFSAACCNALDWVLSKWVGSIVRPTEVFGTASSTPNEGRSHFEMSLFADSSFNETGSH
jgi:hypothetical protein